MLFSRRRTRRSTSRKAASLLALALPAPLARVANSPAGPLLVFLGIPAMLFFGWLQVEWHNGSPQLRVNPQKAGEIREAVTDKLGDLGNQPSIQHWQQTAWEAWYSQQNSSLQSYHPQQLPSTTAQYSSAHQPYPLPQTSPSITQPYPTTHQQDFVPQQYRPTTPAQYSQPGAQQPYTQQPYIQQPYTQQSYSQVEFFQSQPSTFNSAQTNARSRFPSTDTLTMQSSVEYATSPGHIPATTYHSQPGTDRQARLLELYRQRLYQIQQLQQHR
ncbi:MAG: hypothetical protein R3C53_05675 [Pirellulaceae bacterium]